MQPYVNLDKRVINNQKIEHKFDRKIRIAEGVESEAQKRAHEEDKEDEHIKEEEIR